MQLKEELGDILKLEVLLSTMNLAKKDLDKMNITTSCVVINQCGINNYEEYKNFKIYSYNEIGASNSRNRALENSCGDILLFCDDDVIYNENYENIILNEFKKNDVDMIFFNLESPNRLCKQNKKTKKLHLYNSLKYGTYNIAVRKDKIKNIKFNTLFGPNAKYSGGEDTLFIVDCFKNKLNIYSSDKYLGKVLQTKSTWFKGYNEKYFFDKGALFCAINKRFKHILCLQYLIRHKEVLTNIKFIKAYKFMVNGANSYLKGDSYDQCSSSNL